MPTLPTIADLRKDMSDAAGTVGALWFSFVFVLFYFLLAVASVTPRTMFLEDRIKLPFPDVDVPLRAFFWLGPVMVLLAHIYILHQLIMLATKTRRYAAAWVEDGSSDPGQNLLPQIIFVRLLVGPPTADRRPAGILGGIVAWATVVVIPLLTLMFFEAQFLPFHSEATTWWARGIVLIDIALLWWLWPLASFSGLSAPVVPGQPGRMLGWGGQRLFWMSMLSVLAVYMTVLVATFPGETVAGLLPVFPLHETLVGGKDDSGRYSRTIFPNRLFLEGVDLVDHKAYDTAIKAAMALPDHSFSGRHLERAVLTEAQLGRANFVGAYLRGASLIRVRARGAWFDEADLSGAQLDDAELQGASFYKATMIGATLGGAELQGARLAGADLRAAWLTKAELDGASLANADLRRAILDDASLTGVSFKKAKLQGASLAGAHLDGAFFRQAVLWKTDLRRIDPADRVDTRDPGAGGDASCGDPSDSACTDDLRLQTAIEQLVPDEWKRARMLERLLLPLSEDHEEAWEKESDAIFKAIDLKNKPAKDLVMVWSKIACIGRAAPYGIAMLVDTYKDAEDWTRPRDAKSVTRLIEELQGAACAGSIGLPDDLKLGLDDLPAVIAANPSPQPVPSSITSVGHQRRPDEP